MYALISQLTLFCNMQLNVLDDLAEAMKALDGKKVISSLPSHLEVDLSLNSFVHFLVVLAALSSRPTSTSVLLCGGVGSSRPEPWTRLHCSELHWRDPVALSVGQPGAPVSSNDCAHGSNVFFGVGGIQVAHSVVSESLFWMSC